MNKLIPIVLFLILLFIVVLVFLYIRRKTKNVEDRVINLGILDEILSTQSDHNIEIRFSNQIKEKDKIEGELYRYLNIKERSYLIYVTKMAEGRKIQDTAKIKALHESGRKIVLIVLMTGNRDLSLESSYEYVYRALKVDHHFGKPDKFTEQSKKDLTKLRRELS